MSSKGRDLAVSAKMLCYQSCLVALGLFQSSRESLSDCPSHCKSRKYYWNILPSCTLQPTCNPTVKFFFIPPIHYHLLFSLVSTTWPSQLRLGSKVMNEGENYPCLVSARLRIWIVCSLMALTAVPGLLDLVGRHMRRGEFCFSPRIMKCQKVHLDSIFMAETLRLCDHWWGPFLSFW